MNRCSRVLLTLVVSFAIVGFATAGGAATNHNYGNHSGPKFDFIDMNETVLTADDEPGQLFEAPLGVGDQLIFSPSSFKADSANGDGGAGLGALDLTHSLFNTTIMSTGPATIDLIRIEEGGDIILTDFPPGSGTAATGVFATLSGTVEILDSLNLADVGEIIEFGGAGGDFDSTFTPGPSTNFLSVGLQPSGSFAWTGSVEIDVFSLYPGATKVELQLDNILQVSSETGTTALIQKKAVNGPVITVIPEPGTLVLLAPGLIALAVHARRRRAQV